MPNVDLKTLKVIAICISALIAICIAVLVVDNEKPLEVVEVEIVEALNNNEKIMHHSGEIYCYAKVPKNKLSNYMLINLPINFDDNSKRTVIYDYGGSLGKNATLDIYKNKLFYQRGDTYMIDLVDKSNVMFCEGEIQFMIEPNAFIMLKDGDLYKGTYYENNFVVNQLTKIAEGNFVRVGEDDERIYYYSEAGKNNTIVVGLNKKTLNIIIFDNIATYNQKLEDVIVTDDFLFECYGNDENRYIKKVSKKANSQGEYTEELLDIEELDIIEFIDEKFAKPLDKKNKSFNDMYFYGSIIIDPGNNYAAPVLETQTYKYDSKTNKVVKYTTGLNELYPGNYSIKSGDDGCTLYRGEEGLTQIPTEIKDVNAIKEMLVLEINIIEDYLYYEVKISTEDKTDVVLARMKKDSNISKRINIVDKK